MSRIDNLKYFVDPVYRDIYQKGLSSYYDQVELECPECQNHYFSTYGNRFNKEGEVKRTLLCKSCASKKSNQKNQDPEEGTRFGNLTFIKRIEDKVNAKGKHYIQYLCKCDCGNEIEVNKDNLLKDKTTRCKNCKTNRLIEVSKQRGEVTDPPIGTRFGNLIYLEKVYHQDKLGRNIQFYRCRCNCGNIIESDKSTVLRGLVKSCGCQSSRNKLREKRIAIGELSDPSIGSRFGNLTVLNILQPEEGGEKKVECQCDCGNTVIVNKQHLLNGHYRTCGRCPREYPQWLIDRLLDPEQKQLAIDGIILPRKVEIACAKCGKPISFSLNSIIDMKTQKQKRLGCCKHCSHQTSMQEKEILDFLLSLGLEKSQIKTNVRGIIRGEEKNSYKELDFYLPDYKLAIEYNGSYYHSEEKKPKDYHLKKFNLCEELGIRLISIFEMDWSTSKDKLKDLIKYSIIPKIKIPARKCVVKNISEQQAFDFYNLYHIQSKSILAKINVGLYYKDELVSVMGFGSSSFHNRQNNDGDYELHRFVTKSGYTVVGGASKLLSYFEREFKPKLLLSYSWNDWYNGALYSILGFSFDHSVPPDYYWYLNRECINKRKCRLKDLQKKYPELYQESIDNKASNKEDYIMEKLGAIKVYRSGSKRWVKRYV